MQLTGFEGQAAFVAGAGGGVGRAVTALLAEAGARVMATDLPGVMGDAPQRPGVTWAPLDVTDAEAVEAALEAAEQALGPIRHGIFCSGILQTQSLLDTSAEDWRRVIEVNLTGGFTVCTALGRRMAAQGAGGIVAVGSNAAGIPRLGMGAYPASKAGLHMLIRCLGLELAPHGVRCNIVAPGSTLTPMLRGMWADPSGAEATIAGNLATHRTGIPLGKLARPEDIGQSVLFLLSDQAGHVTMADLYVDGGATLRG
ncbi:SDR family oxidoreductase [Pseudoroseicyclus aestuarii]|uniref:2,3-dihydro-2,3-dihydroxybenzoate dehydrogenase n=1 Tax=Pseudoroseicyclus aestuarii TaxID=1795041 RepID=A0A318SRQ0_9RHOB|nr:SDR family oxidoreductase [Pseudoroseicyclus aestuarii]PYE84353.1 2,3-dihydro-2,3-dihydroxybenzoate dehydrogenase [Pseudoroseicyclus aestuarii]